MFRRFLIFVMALTVFVQAQSVPQKPEGAHLPLVTAGTVLRWSPSGDIVLFDLPEASWIRLSIYSPSIDLNETGDERYNTQALEASFRLSSTYTTLASERFGLAASNWLTFYEGPAEAGRHLLESHVEGSGKNVYLLKLETELSDIDLLGYSATVNASSESWADAFSFDIAGYNRCQLELYDGDGSEELEARLVLPSGARQAVPVSEDLEALRTQYLPRLPGLYTVQLRLPENRYQKTNSVRFSVICEDVPQLVTLVPAEQLNAPELGPIDVEVIDTEGNALNIPYDITGRFERTVSLREDPAYRLVERRTEGGEKAGERSVLFGLEGGKVTFILERLAVALPLPETSVEVAPARPLELPQVKVDVLPYPDYALSRSLEHSNLIVCQTVEVVLTVENRGDGAGTYTLREAIPAGLKVVGHDAGELSGENKLVWQGAVEAGSSVTHRYLLELTAEAASRVRFRGVLEPSETLEPIVIQNSLSRAEFRTELTRVDDNKLYVKDEVPLEVTVFNPLEREVTVRLGVMVSGRAELLEEPASLTLPAGGSASTTLKVHGIRSGNALVQVTPYACDLTGTAGGPSSPLQLSFADVPSLPKPRQTTTIVVDMAAYDLPLLDGLVLVEHLPEGVRYIAGSTALNGVAAPDPAQADDALIFELPGQAVGQVSFTVLHDGPLVLDESHSSLIGLTPEPELLLGREKALDLYARAEPIAINAVVRERVGAVILSPVPGTLLRERDRITVSTDTPLGSEVTLLINGEAVSDELVGQRVLDPNLSRQTFDYIGVPLVAGPNELRLEASLDGDLWSDSLTVYFSGPAESFTLTPLTPLVADSAEPLELDITLQDAWGNAPMDGFITLEVAGARSSLEDARPERVGYQLPLENGHVRLELEPLSEPDTVTVSVLIGDALQSQEVVVTSNLRPWIVTGLGSAGAAYDPGDGDFNFGVGGGFFARGSVFRDYLLTLAARYPFGELGPGDSNPYQTFPVPGSSGSLAFDAYSQHGVYVRLERDLSYLQYGDFSPPLLGEFLNPGGSYTGLSGEYHSEGFAVRAYGAYMSVTNQRSVDLKSDGTSLRFLPDAPIKPGSLSVEVIKKDDLGVTIPEDDGDPLTRVLEPLVDFRVDEEVGLLELFKPVPLSDDEGNPYYVRLSYTLSEDSADPRFVQAGVQGEASLGGVTFRAGVAQERRSETRFSRVVAGGASYQSESFQAEAEVAYGTNESVGGIAVSTRLLYRANKFTTEASWRFLAAGYRSPTVTSDGSAGHTATLNASYQLTPAFSVAAGANWLYKNGSSTLTGDAFGRYQGRGFDAQFGVNVESSLLRPLLGFNFYDLFGWRGSRVGAVHRQGVGAEARSVTQFSAAFPLLSNLSLTLTDELVWGNSNALLVGLEASLDNSRTLSSLCRTLECAFDPATPLGTTTVTAQYELPGGLSAEASKVRLGLDTTYPVTENLSVDLGAEHRRDLNDPAQTTTVLRTGATYDTEDFDTSVRYEVSFDPTHTKHVITAGSNFALNERWFGSLTGTYVLDSADKSGFSFSVASAYRGDRLSVLTQNTVQFSDLASEGDNLTGDTRLTWRLAERYDLRLGYAYRWLVGDSYFDLLNLGLSLHAWEGSNVLAQLRFFNDWTLGERAFGAGLEVSQRLGCGVYGVAGYNLGGLDRDYGSVYGGNGAFIRLDVVFDEQWTCGSGELSGHIFIDANANGKKDEGETGLPGVSLELYNTHDERVASALSGTDGYYRFKRVKPGRYTLLVSAPIGFEEIAGKELELGFAEQLGLDISIRPREGGE